MAANWMRRTVLVAACASAALLAACGSSTTESAITPDRFIAFGDANSDVGQKGTRYTVNDGSVNNWTLQVTANYGKPLTPVSAGGLSYAVGNARIKAKPDATGDASTPTVTEQIDTFLAGEDMAAQVRRLVNAGAKYVVVTGTYDLSKTPWAKAIGRESLLHDASSRFNDGLLVNIVDLGANVLYIDLAYYVNVYTGAPGNYGFNNATDAVCTSVDATNGIGIGAGQVNSALCTPSTLLSGASQDSYVFADRVYMTPLAHRQFGTYAYDRLRALFMLPARLLGGRAVAA